jgi:hypothetical protein
MSWIVDSAQVATAAFTAGAAYAAYKSVQHGQQIWRAAQSPDMHLQVLLNEDEGTTDIVLVNAGSGVARGVAFVVAAEGQRAAGYIGDGFMAAAQKAVIQTKVPQSTSARCFVMYRDLDETSWVVPHDGSKRRLRLGRQGASTRVSAIWNESHPELPWDSLKPAGYRVAVGSL